MAFNLAPEYIAQQEGWLRARKERIVEQQGIADPEHVILLHDQLRRIQFALRRIEQGQYGLCPHCGCLIERERLEIEPEILLCDFCSTSQ